MSRRREGRSGRIREAADGRDAAPGWGGTGSPACWQGGAGASSIWRVLLKGGLESVDAGWVQGKPCGGAARASRKAIFITKGTTSKLRTNIKHPKPPDLQTLPIAQNAHPNSNLLRRLHRLYARPGILWLLYRIRRLFASFWTELWTPDSEASGASVELANTPR
ncbi:uncharacterized protein BDZ99DRAFT_470898 [Mytilinidion resinicola]|uniref:Uncharacterized protein n=1 Tax=Mytilinidion resinicola TaxID=574789 RepID=A0A6A6ZAC2_9PEZI|nr:uncharacterized protein BDZ99DRAFT_470898 [Mytilinidion resinicola]KAF2817966.1 hypothetical protein BDZ99DRAFT_470898 [Mytilinidion resinicola]